MEKFTKLTARAAYLDLVNIDTDMIIPKQFLKTIKRTGLGASLFYEMGYDESGNKINDFILHQESYKKSKILIAGDNFGCGSSREHAPWALIDFGIKVVIATSFADIFYNNCFKNGILPIILDDNQVKELMDYAKNPHNELTIDLELQKISFNNEEVDFKINDFKKNCLINGLDDIGITLTMKDKIDDYENEAKDVTPWLFKTAND
ncbi:3-isopropylmalate dehydratase small subunit [Rickettsiales bacterium]|nr:3-isopropylmalate dehydratase small subunit [Rickettsiales bacterium]MDB2550791.1 3-isopropylmalate dehydratase small subunit [Rickettsiales bacterium]